jgi:aminoglycoside 2'-N-acetyltransferase I
VLRVAHTADLDRAELSAARALLDEAFTNGFSDHDWEHSLGGMHALVWDGSELVGHASVAQRRLLHAGRALRTGYVEGVGVRADRRRQGYGASLMRALGRVIEAAYEIGALSATEQGAPFYESLGWQRWRGPTSALTPSGIVRTPEEDGSIYVLTPTQSLDFDGELTCDWRDGDLW